MSDIRTRSQDADHREDVDPSVVVDRSPEALFIANFDEIRSAACKDVAGVALVAVDTRSAGVVGTAWIGRETDRPNSLVVGSHEMCDLVVDDEALALRHIAVLVPAGDARPAEFSLHDLHTGQGFTLEDGESALAATVSRFGVVELGPCMIFCFTTGVGGDWSRTAADAWVELGGETKTVYREEKSGAAKPVLKEFRAEHVGSYVAAIQGPMRTSDRLLKVGEEHVAELRVQAGDKVDRMALGPSALERGVLVGRADRCASILRVAKISRVHVLVIALDGEVVAVDTGSTNGVFRDREAKVRARVVMLSRGERAALVDEDASVSVR